MPDALSLLVPCATLRGSFPSGVPARGCLRRQLEAKRIGKEWAPAHPSCSGCELGGTVRAQAEAEGIALATCEDEGHAIIAADRCETCAEAKRGFLRPHRPEVSTRLWSGEVPDVPLGGPPATSKFTGFRPSIPAGMNTNPELAARTELKRRVAVAAAGEERRSSEMTEAAPPSRAPQVDLGKRVAPPAGPSPDHAAPAPATPAEEDEMPKGKRSAPMPCCGSMSLSTHKMGCKEAGRPTAPAKSSPKPARTPAKVTNLPARRAARDTTGEEFAPAILDEVPFELLIARRDALDAAIDRRVHLVEEELQALKAAQAKAHARVEAAG